MTPPAWDSTGQDELLTVRSRAAGEAVVITVTGELDIDTAPQLRAAITAAFEDGPRSTLALDLTGVSFLGSTGLALLVETARQLARRAASLRIVLDARSAVFGVFEATGLDKVLTLCGTVAEALADGRALR